MIYTGHNKRSVYFKCSKCDKIKEVAPFIILEDNPEYIRLINGAKLKCKCGNIKVTDENEIITKLSINDDENTLRCERCGSTNIQLMKRGFTVTTGFLGSGKNQRVCKNCLYKW